MNVRLLLPVLLGAALLSACSDDPPSAPAASVGSASPSSGDATASAPAGTPGSPRATATSSPAPVPSVSPAVPFPADTSVDTERPSGEPLTVTSVRAARQAGYDRVVFELEGKGAGAPGWRVEYVDRAVQDGSGDEVEVAGDSILSVVLEGIGLPFDTGKEEASQDLTPRDTDRVREVDLQATYEGRFTAFVGVDRKVPFRVFRLTDPTRVVVDLRHE